MFCFPSPNQPIFFEVKKKNSRFTSQRSKYFNLPNTRSCYINSNWYDVMSFSLINIDTMSFKGCFDSRVNMHLLPPDYISNRVNVGFNNQVFLFSSPAFSGTQTRSSVHSFLFFFRPDRPTISRDGAMGNETFYWDGLTYLLSLSSHWTSKGPPKMTILISNRTVFN